jgi:hypothetical protein
LPDARGKTQTLQVTFEQETVPSNGGNDAARTLGRFQQRNFSPQLPQAKGACQSADTAADNDDVFVNRLGIKSYRSTR